MSFAMHTPIPLPRHWQHWLAAFTGVAAALYIAAVIGTGAAASADAMTRLGLELAAGGTAVASVAYLVRFARWHWLVARLGARVPFADNLRVYLAGLALTSSPAKAGETVRSLLLLRYRVPVAGSLGAFLSDRGADVLGMALLGATAGWAAGARSEALEALAVAMLTSTPVAAAFLRRRGLAGLDARLATRHSGLARGVATLASPALAWARLWTWGAFVPYAAFAVVAYGVQALVFAWYVHALGASVSTLHCVVIFANAMLLGAASMVPGGLGATEAAIVFQLTAAGMPTTDAVAAAIVLRLSTLWFAMLLGLACLLSINRPERSTGAQP